MTEARGEYAVGLDASPNNRYICRKCGAVVGELVEVEVDGKRRVMLRRKGLLIEWAPRMWCECGGFLSFAASDRTIEGILERRKK